MGKIAKQFDVRDCNTIDMVLEKSGTAWVPQLVKASDVITSPGIDASGFQAVVNPSNSKVLAFPGKRYRKNDHMSQVQALQPLVQSGEILPAKVSVWDNGAVIAYQFRVPSLEHVVTHSRMVSDLFTLAFWHNGLGADKSFFASFNWFCLNQMGMVKKANGDNTTVRHSGAVLDKYAELVHSQILRLKDASTERYDAMRRMTDKRLVGADLLQFFALSMGDTDSNTTVAHLMANGKDQEKLSGMAKTVRAIVDSYRKDDAGAPQTVWHAYNGLTRYVTHDQGRNEATRSARALLGQGQGVIARAWDTAVALAA